jgi:hypothetical protein
MDVTKCKALKHELASQEEPQLVSIDRFFDGNDDEGSIGCNLMKHPGVDTFRRTFGLLVSTEDYVQYRQNVAAKNMLQKLINALG